MKKTLHRMLCGGKYSVVSCSREAVLTRMTAINRKRQWFILLTLLMFVTVLAAPCTWLAVKMQQAKRQREAVAAIETLGGEVFYNYQCSLSGNFTEVVEPSEPKWLRNLLGDDFFRTVYWVNLGGGEVTDSELEHLEVFSRLQGLCLNGATKVTDSGLEHLKGLSRLEKLGLGSTQLTDSGLEHLKGLSRLERLELGSTQLTDVGLEYLKGLNQLAILELSDTKVTDEGLKKLQQALPDCRIHCGFDRQ